MTPPRTPSTSPKRQYFVVDGVPVVTCRSPGGNAKTLAYGPSGAMAFDWLAGSENAVPISEVEFWIRVCHAQIASERVAAGRQ